MTAQSVVESIVQVSVPEEGHARDALSTPEVLVQGAIVVNDYQVKGGVARDNGVSMVCAIVRAPDGLERFAT